MILIRYHTKCYFNMDSKADMTQLNLPHTTHTHTHTRLTALFPGPPGSAGTRKVTPIWIFVKQETVSGSAISWAICKSAPHSRQITTPAPDNSVFYRPDALPAAQTTASKHWRHYRTQPRTKKGKQNKLKSIKRICSEVSVNTPENPWSKSWRQEAQLSLRDRAMRRVSWNLTNWHATVQKLLVQQALNKSK